MSSPLITAAGEQKEGVRDDGVMKRQEQELKEWREVSGARGAGGEKVSCFYDGCGTLSMWWGGGRVESAAVNSG